MTPARPHILLALFLLVAGLGLTWPLSLLFADALPLILGLPRGLFAICCWAAATFLALLIYDRALASSRGEEEAP
jgi:polyferredoxin